MKDKLKSARERLLASLPPITQEAMVDIAAYAVNRVLSPANTNVVEAGPGTLAACAGFIAGRADNDLHTTHFRQRILTALYANIEENRISLKFLLGLEKVVANAYTAASLPNPPTIRQFLSSGAE